MQKEFSVGGLQDPGYGIGYKFTMQKEPFVQILHVNGNHWVCVSNMMSKKGMIILTNLIASYIFLSLLLTTGHIQVFDSVNDDITSDTVNQICSIVRSQKRVLQLKLWMC